MLKEDLAIGHGQGLSQLYFRTALHNATKMFSDSKSIFGTFSHSALDIERLKMARCSWFSEKEDDFPLDPILTKKLIWKPAEEK